ncbi:helix-turn-helix domain-containing protein [Streptomyces capparidis]
MTTMPAPQDLSLPEAERAARWRESCLRLPVPLHADLDPSVPFRVRASALTLGAVHTLAVDSSRCRIRRTAGLIRRADPEMLLLDLVLRGRKTVDTGRQSEVGPAEMVLMDGSRPCRIAVGTDGDRAVRGIVVMLPRQLLPLGPRLTQRALGVPASARTGPGRLLSDFLTTLMSGECGDRIPDSGRLGGVVADLVTATYAACLDEEAALPSESARGTLRLQVRDFVLRHLDDESLSPATIAAAHNISVRYLHKLFQEDGSTVGDWVRGQRLERCRRDLADPLRHDRPVHAIATRWGFPNAAHFSRAFRAAYGLSPRAFRERALLDAAVHDETSGVRSGSTTS